VPSKFRILLLHRVSSVGPSQKKRLKKNPFVNAMLVWSIVINGVGAIHPSSQFSFYNEFLWLAHHNKKMFETLKTCQYKNVFTSNIETWKSKYSPNYMNSKRITLGIVNGIKWGVIGNMLGNTLGTWWEQPKNCEELREDMVTFLLCLHY